MENLRHSPSLKIISVTFCNNRDGAYHNPAALSTSIVPLQVLSTDLGKVSSCTLEWINSSGKRLILLPQSILSTFKSSQQSMSSVTVYVRFRMMYVCISKCIHLVYMNLEHLSSMCAYDDTSRLDVLRISRLVSSSHTVYEMMNDDEYLD